MNYHVWLHSPVLIRQVAVYSVDTFVVFPLVLKVPALSALLTGLLHVPFARTSAGKPGLIRTEHVSRNIHDCTFWQKYFLPDFLDTKSPENVNFISQKLFPNFTRHNLLFLQKPRHPLFITAITAFHRSTFSFSTPHFVNHCTLKHALSL